MGMNNSWILFLGLSLNWIRSLHLGLFLRSIYRMGIFFFGAVNFQILFGMPDIFWG